MLPLPQRAADSVGAWECVPAVIDLVLCGPVATGIGATPGSVAARARQAAPCDPPVADKARDADAVGVAGNGRAATLSEGVGGLVLHAGET
jgi:hypothetical protein